jgi:YVTN family beta-propeller protein
MTLALVFASLLYVSNERSGTIRVIDTRTTRGVPTDDGPWALVMR